MDRTMDETQRRRRIQSAYNETHNIRPETIKSRIKDIMESVYEQDYVTVEAEAAEEEAVYGSLADLRKEIARLEKGMQAAAKELAFEEAARLRDRIKELRELELTWL